MGEENLKLVILGSVPYKPIDPILLKHKVKVIWKQRKIHYQERRQIMYISKTVTTDVDVCIEVEPEDVLDEMSLEEIQSYYKKRFKINIFTDLTDEEIKEILIQLIIGRCARNMESDNQTIKESINSLMEQVLI